MNVSRFDRGKRSKQNILNLMRLDSLLAVYEKKSLKLTTQVKTVWLKISLREAYNIIINSLPPIVTHITCLSRRKELSCSIWRDINIYKQEAFAT